MGIAYNPRIVTDGLVLALDAANTKSYPGSGTTWTDFSGNGNTGTLNNMDATNYSNINSGRFSFDATNEYVSTPTLSTQFLTTGLTISIFFYYTPTTTNDNLICCGTSAFNGTSNAWEIRLRGNAGNIEFSPGRGPGGTGIPERLQYASPSGWGSRILCIDVTYVANGLSTLYENGVSRATRDYSGVGTSTQTNPIWIGRATDTYFPGYVYSVKVYNKALTAAEVQQNFNALRSRFSI